MILLLKRDASPRQAEELAERIEKLGFGVSKCVGEMQTILGVLGDTSTLDAELFASMEGVESVRRVQEPYKLANRAFHPGDTVIETAGGPIGGGHFLMMAGPCTIESEEQIVACAVAVRKSGANVLRGGAFKPRTSPYSFQGLREDGLRLLLNAKKATGLPVISEIMEISYLPLYEDVDIIQVGARNMQNFELLKELGHTRKPVLLKRGPANTLQELLMSAEYILAGGNSRVILCERGIRTFETATRNTLDLSAVPMLRRLTHLPVAVDPSHGTGSSELVPAMALAAAAAGADGLLLEVHNEPSHALCDGRQSLSPEQFDALCSRIEAILPFAAEKHTWKRGE